jgi:hypothetical protein
MEVLNNNLKPLQDKISHQHKEKALFGYTNIKQECYITTQTLDTRTRLYFQGKIKPSNNHTQLCGTLNRPNYLLMLSVGLTLFLLITSLFSTINPVGLWLCIILLGLVTLINLIVSQFNYQTDYNFMIGKLNLLLQTDTPLIKA